MQALAPGSSSPTTPIPPEELHGILQDWTQLITSLGSLIRDNVEGLLPAVFGLASLANRVNDAQLGTQGQTRDLTAALRNHVQAADGALATLADAMVAGRDGSVSSEDSGAACALRVGKQALQAMLADLDLAEQRVRQDAEQLHAASVRVRQFAESSREAIDQLILKLQFQDRTDQILSHLRTDFESLGSSLTLIDQSTFDLDGWRRERRQRFTTVEERHAGQVAPSTESGEIELF